MSGDCDNCGEHALKCGCNSSKLEKFHETGLIGCLNESGINSKDYKKDLSMIWKGFKFPMGFLIVYNEAGKMRIGKCDPATKELIEWYECSQGEIAYEVQPTHWMPLPEPPKE